MSVTTLPNVPTNQLQSIRFLDATNAAITLPTGPAGALDNFPVTYAPGTQQATFTIQALVQGLATTVPFVVVDNCGDWPTFAGAGPNNLPAASFPASPSSIPLLVAPTSADNVTSNFFDHDLPFEFSDTNGYQLTYWGERWTRGVDGHSGYDWRMPIGTPLLAGAPGRVVFAGAETPFFCPPLNATVSGLDVEIQFSGYAQRFLVTYVHLSRIDVTNGQFVAQGQQIGLSGTTGCSTGPHLHFAVYRLTAGNRYVLIDPYGWTGPGADPWSVYPVVATSINLWQDGRGPALYQEFSLAPNPSGSTAPVTLTRVRYMGADDAHLPNNEFIEVSLDARFAPSGRFDLTGFSLRNDAGQVFAFPSGFVLTTTPVRVYSGSGMADPGTLYWGRAAGVWNNNGDCVRLVYPGGAWYRLSYGSSACP